MAGIYFYLNPPAVAIATGTAKSVLKLTAPSNHRVLIHQFGLGANGVTAADPPALIQWKLATTSGTFTALTPAALMTYAETIQTVGGHTATAEPTMTVIKWSDYLHMQTSTGLIIPKTPLVVQGGEIFSLLVTPGTMTGCNVIPWALCEE